MKKTLLTLTSGLLLASSLTACATTDISSAQALETTSQKEPLVTPLTITDSENTQSQSSMDIYSQLTDAVEKASSKNYPDENEEVDTVITLGSTALNSIEILGENVLNQDGNILIQSGGSYMFTGNFNGQILIDTDDEDVQLLLYNLHLENDQDAPISIIKADEVTITLMSGTQNSIIDNSPYHEEDSSVDVRSNGAIFSKDDLAINGDGNLTIVSEYKSGILGKDDVLILGGNIDIQSPRNGIKGNDLVYISDGVIDISAGTDGIESVTLVCIDGGNTTIHESYEGIEALDIIINDGNIDITASDDAINISGSLTDADGTLVEALATSTANLSTTNQNFGRGQNHPESLTGHGLYINGGELTANSYGDGLDSNGNFWMSGGTVVVDGPETDREGSLDADLNFQVTGGELLAVGSSGMMRNPDAQSTVNTLSVAFDQFYSAGTHIAILDENLNTVAEYTPEKSFASIIYVSPQLQLNETYTITIDGNVLDTYELTETISTFGSQSSHGGRGTRPAGGPKDDRRPPNTDTNS